MTILSHTIRRVVLRRPGTVTPAAAADAAEPGRRQDAGRSIALDIAANDPIVAFFQTAPGAVELKQLELDSPALEQMRSQGITMVVPLVTQGELIGLLNLGPRLSDQEYSADDRRLLESLASQAAPAVKVGQLVREQEVEVRARERLEQELQVARLIQQNFLPKHLPELAGWRVAAYYRPARTVGGDFYDFIELPGGLMGLVVGDVTDKGVPAAMVMAATRSVLRAAAQRLLEPGMVLRRVNETLCPEIPRQHVRHLSLRGAGSGHRGAPVRECGPQPPDRAPRRRRLGAPRHRDAARPDAGHGLRGEGGDARARLKRAPVQRRPDRGPRPRPRDVRHPAGCASGWRPVAYPTP